MLFNNIIYILIYHVIKIREKLKYKKGDIFAMRMEKRKFRIGELAEKVGVEQFVIRFWEKEFGIKPLRSHGGQRFYEEKEFDKFQLIRNLLYKKKFTIAGAKIELKETLSKSKKIIPSKTTVLTLEEDVNKILDDAKSLEQKFKPATSKSLTKQLSQLKIQLVKLKELL